MYHIVVAAPNQEATSLLTRVEESFALKKTELTFSFAEKPEALAALIPTEKPDYVFLSSSFSPEQQLALVTALATAMKKSKRIIPLVYLIDWSNPISSVLGTNWSSQVGILHSYSSRSEIIDLFQRLDGWGVTVGH